MLTPIHNNKYYFDEIITFFYSIKLHVNIIKIKTIY